MTKQEHDLMLALFAIQMQVSVMILELLQSRDVAEAGDVGPFLALALSRVREHAPVYLATYSQVAKSAGVELPKGFAPSA